MLAIVIPYYKKTFFKQTLESLANQTNKNFKVFIGNDASLEDPTDIIESFKDQLNIIYQNFNENLGGNSLVKQWNRCLAMVKEEEWVTILGDDDCYENNVVQEFYNNLNEINTLNANVVRYATAIINQKFKVKSETFKHPKLESNIEFINRKFSKQTRSSLSEQFFRFSELKKVGFTTLPLAWHSDDIAIIQIANTTPIFSINKAKIFVRVSDQSITGSKKHLIQKSTATQQFILKYLLPLKNKLTPNTRATLYKKLEHAYINSNTSLYFWSIIRFYIKTGNIYCLTRFIYLIFRQK